MNTLAVIEGPALSEILRRNATRARGNRLFRGGRTHTARLSDCELVESNLPLPNHQSPVTNNHSP